MGNLDSGNITLNGYIYKVWSYEYVDVDTFAPQRREGLPKYQDFAPETVLAWSTWHRGYGDFYYDDPASYYSATGVDASLYGQMTLAAAIGTMSLTNGNPIDDVITQWPEYRGTLIAIGNKGAYKWNAAASPNGFSLSATWATPPGRADIFTVNAVASTSVVPGGQYLYVPTASQQWMYNGTSWISVATMAAHFQTIRNELWKVYYDANGLWKAAKTTDGVTYPAANIIAAGTSSVNVQIGSGFATVNTLLNYDNRLYPLGQSGVTTLDSVGDVIDLIPEAGRFADPNFGNPSDVFHGVGYIGSDQGLLQFYGSSVTNPQVSQAMHSVGPDKKSWSQSEVRGRFAGLAPHVNFLYGTLNAQSGNGYVVKWRDYPDLQPGQGWHPIAKFASATMGACKVSNLSGRPVLWVSAGNGVVAFNLPKENDNPLVDSTCQFQPSGTFDLPQINDNMSLLKDWLKFTLDIVNQPNTTVTMQASFDNGPYQTVDAVSGASGVFDFYFSTFSTSFLIQPRILLSSGSATQTPVIRSVALHHVVRPPLRGRWQIDLLPQEKAVAGDNETSDAKVQALKAARNLPGLVNFIDVDGLNYSVTVEKFGLSRQAREAGRGTQFIAHVVLQDYGLQNYYFDNPGSLFDESTFGAEQDVEPAAYFDYSYFDYSYFT